MRPDRLSAPPPGRIRLIVSVFIIGWLLWQVGVPSSYYLDGNPSDERFSWRMFSDLLLLHRTCEIVVVETVEAAPGGPGSSLRQVRVGRPLGRIWIRALRESRRVVVEKFLRRRCQSDPAVTAVEFRRACQDASRLPPVQIRLSCRTGALTESLGGPGRAGASR